MCARADDDAVRCRGCQERRSQERACRRACEQAREQVHPSRCHPHPPKQSPGGLHPPSVKTFRKAVPQAIMLRLPPAYSIQTVPSNRWRCLASSSVAWRSGPWWCSVASGALTVLSMRWAWRSSASSIGARAAPTCGADDFWAARTREPSRLQWMRSVCFSLSAIATASGSVVSVSVHRSPSSSTYRSASFCASAEERLKRPATASRTAGKSVWQSLRRRISASKFTLRVQVVCGGVPVVMAKRCAEVPRGLRPKGNLYKA
mmetsp:Transcript_755/g.2535  ORF Transcript_755/g.2535 Transcript_755/m.2535 type:complete len:261 (+) Transcript_755:255-1037(+)